MAFAAAYDLLTMRIPNWISIALLASFVGVSLLAGLSLPQIGISVAVGVAVLVVSFLLFIPGWIGGGDAKLAAVIALWMGLDKVLEFLVYSALLGAVLTFAILLFRWKVNNTWLPSVNWILRLHDNKKGVPYGIALAAGAMIVYTQTAIYTGLALI